MKFRGLALVALFYGVIPFAQVIDYIQAQPFALAVDNANYVASILAYNWMLLNVILGLKLPWAQRLLPYDARIRIHVLTTLGMAGFLLWHTVYYLFLRAKEIDLVTWTLMGAFVTLVSVSLLWVPIPGFKRLREGLRRTWSSVAKISYDWLKTAHKALFLALAALTFWHVLDAKLLGVASVWSTLWFEALFVVAATLYIVVRAHNWFLPQLTVAAVETSGTIVRLTLRPHSRLRYRAGQFAFLRFAHPELRGEEHPFSFTTARHEPHVGFAMRSLGDFTRKVAKIKPGDKVQVNGGFGSFHPRRSRRPLVLIGTGIGTAPLTSLLKDMARRAPHREVVALFAVRTRQEVLSDASLDEVTRTMPRLRVRWLIRDEGAPLISASLLTQELDDPRRYEVYLCSSDAVRKDLLPSLRSLGIPAPRIHYEAFSLG